MRAMFATAMCAAVVSVGGCNTVEGVGKDVSAAATGLEDALFGPTEVVEATGDTPREAHGGRGPACDPYADLLGGPQKDLYAGLPPCK